MAVIYEDIFLTMPKSKFVLFYKTGSLSYNQRIGRGIRNYVVLPFVWFLNFQHNTPIWWMMLSLWKYRNMVAVLWSWHGPFRGDWLSDGQCQWKDEPWVQSVIQSMPAHLCLQCDIPTPWLYIFWHYRLFSLTRYNVATSRLKATNYMNVSRSKACVSEKKRELQPGVRGLSNSVHT